jgi:predicted outer membrane protein
MNIDKENRIMSGRKLKAFLGSFALVFGLSGLAVGQTQPGEHERPGAEPTQERPTEEPRAEEPRAGEQVAQRQEEALAQVHAINQSITDFALLGMNKAENEELRELATTLYDQQRDAERDLMERANEANVDVVGTQQARQAEQQLTQRFEQQAQQLQQAEGQQFDQQYLDLVVQAHQQAIQNLEQVRQQVQQPELQQHIDERLQNLQENLQQAQELQRQIGEQPQQPQPQPGM